MNRALTFRFLPVSFALSIPALLVGLAGCSSQDPPASAHRVVDVDPSTGGSPPALSVVASLSDGTEPGCVDPPPGMLLWLPGDGNAHDIAGGNATLVRGEVGFAPAVVGRGFVFQAPAAYIEIPYREKLDLGRGPGKEWTLDFWYMATDDGLPPDRELVVKRIGTTSELTDYRIFLERDWEEPSLVWGTGLSEDPCAWLAAPEPSRHEWHHVAGVFRSTGEESGEKALYIDGALAGECTYRIKAAVVSSPLRIGRGVDRQFYGMIDEVEIFARALDAEVILALYNAGSTGKCKVLLATIDVLPPHINPGSNRIVHVAVLGTPAFDVADVDAASVTLGPARAVPADPERVQDVDNDGDLDLVFDFRIQDTGVTDGDTEVCLEGLTRDGAGFRGCAPIHTVASTADAAPGAGG